MFEMKNELDEGANKKKNEDFFKKLATRTGPGRGCSSTRCWSLCSSPRVSSTTAASSTSHIGTRGCTWSGRSSSHPDHLADWQQGSPRTTKFKAELWRWWSKNIDITNSKTNLETFKSGFERNYDLA